MQRFGPADITRGLLQTAFGRGAAGLLVVSLATASCGEATPSPENDRPAPTPATQGPTSSVTASGIVLAASLNVAQVPPGQPLVATVRATNTSNRPIKYLGGDATCVATASLWVDFSGLKLDEGRTWPGVQGDVKDGLIRATKEPVSLAAVGAPRSGCDIVSGASKLAPTESVSTTAIWDGRLSGGYPTPAGSYEVKVRFLVEAADGVKSEVLTSVPFRVVGSWNVNPPGKAIDIMLSQPKLAAWLADHPQERWSEIHFMFSSSNRYELEIAAVDGQTIRVAVAGQGYGPTTVAVS
ncbi:MAG: hypothetical protein H0U52_01230 [Chloroflexi bacterium]|nr:hypothetical protein [Chloroflexota bacterium]